MKLRTITQITVDGVVQGNGGASDEDRANGFERGGWALGAGDAETLASIHRTYQSADAFLFGRRTYELFADYWGAIDDPTNPIAGPLNSRPKYVATNTLTEARWSNTTVLAWDIADAIRDLKNAPGGELQVHGSGTFVRWLLAKDLVDELTFLTIPVIVGQGQRLFPQDGPDLALDLVDTQIDSRGVTIQTFRPAGHPHYANNRKRR